MNIYFSGFCGKPGFDEWLCRKAKWTHRCISYAYLDPESPLHDKRPAGIVDACEKHGVRMFLDSGAFSFHTRMRGASAIEIDRFIEGYVKFLTKKQKKRYDFYVNFDYVKHAPTVWKVQKLLERDGLKPAPVFHGDDGFTWLRKYIDAGHQNIMIGRVAKLGSDELRRYYSRVFEITEKHGVKCHGLMVTGRNMWRFPWHSVDSATWLRIAVVGGSIVTVDQKRKTVGSTNVVKPVPDVVKRYLEDTGGIEFQKLATDYRYRCLYNVRQFLSVKADATWRDAQSQWSSIL